MMVLIVITLVLLVVCGLLMQSVICMDVKTRVSPNCAVPCWDSYLYGVLQRDHDLDSYPTYIYICIHTHTYIYIEFMGYLALPMQELGFSKPGFGLEEVRVGGMTSTSMTRNRESLCLKHVGII